MAAQQPAWADLPAEILTQVFQLVQLGPQAGQERISRQEDAMQTTCTSWTSAWTALSLEGHLELRAPVGREGVRAAKGWLEKQGFSRLRHVSTNSPAVLDMLAGCTALRSMQVYVKGPLPPFLGPLSRICSVPELDLQLSASAQGARGLAPILAQRPRLVTLKLRAALMDDFGQLGRVSTLRSLDLTLSGDVPDLDPLAALPSLHNLRLILDGDLGPGLVKLSGLRRLTALEAHCQLDGYGSQLDLRDLSGLTALLRLSLTGAYVADLGPLAGLTLLTALTLWLDLLQPVDLRPLRSMAALASLDLESCGALTDLRPLGQLGALQHLELSFALCLTDLGPLAASTSITSLSLAGCPALTDLRGLAGMRRLATLRLHHARSLVDVGALAFVPSMQELSLAGLDSLSDIGPLRHQTALEWLFVEKCPLVADISPLSGLTALQRLVLRDLHPLASLAPLAGLVSLRLLMLRGDHDAPDFTPLTSLASLMWLAVSRPWLEAARSTLGPSVARGLLLEE